MTEQLADEILDRAYWDSFCKEQYTILYREDEQNPIPENEKAKTLKSFSGSDFLPINAPEYNLAD